MRIGLRYITPVLAAAAAALAIAAAPTAAAASTDQTQSSCNDVGGSETICQSPGNVEINDSPPVNFAPLYPYWEGGYGGYVGGGGYGGMHGGGMGGGHGR
jgi:hypothetical protein